MNDNTAWMDLDALAASYQRVNGVRPNRLRIGNAVAEQVEPNRDPGHPLHTAWTSQVAGSWWPEQPQRLSWWQQVKRERRCRKVGGHWWHPADPMIAWFCCRCGKDRDGMPRDGT